LENAEEKYGDTYKETIIVRFLSGYVTGKV